LTRDKILLCIAWPYAGGPRHVGHVAGFAVPSDVFARYQRMRGADVLMVSGTDEHGTPITYGADNLGVSPREFADRNSAIIVEDLRQLGMSYDTFTRTTTRNHYRVTQEVFLSLYDKGHIISRTQLGAVSPTTGRTLPDRYIEGTCPVCGFGEARGDQCDNCGSQLDPTDLINPRSRVNGEIPEFRETEHLFFDLPAFAGRLREWIGAQAHWRPNVRRYSLNFVDDLKQRAITRDLDWGIPVPLEDWRDRPNKRLYVWFDAVIGYLSATREWAANRGTPDAWQDWWRDQRVKSYYFMGKDNIIFHSVMWPSILLGLGDLVLPHNIVSSEFLTMEGRQFSTSRNHVIYVRDFLTRYDADTLRFFLTIAGPETSDTDFTWAEFVRRNNDELVSTWGNLVHRTLTNAYRNFGAVPDPGDLSQSDRALLAAIEAGFDTTGQLLDSCHFKGAISEVLRLAALVNVFLSEEQPWKLVNTDRSRAATSLFVAIRCVDSLKTLMAPFLPFSSQRLHEMLGYTDTLSEQPTVREYEEPDGLRHSVLGGTYDTTPRWRPSTIEPGRRLAAPQPLFRKLDDSVVEEELTRMRQAATR
jgi:methionyl-tRNA synthetase